MNTKYDFGKSVAVPFADTVDRVINALNREGFGILTDIDVAATMRRGSTGTCRRTASLAHATRGWSTAPSSKNPPSGCCSRAMSWFERTSLATCGLNSWIRTRCSNRLKTGNRYVGERSAPAPRSGPGGDLESNAGGQDTAKACHTGFMESLPFSVDRQHPTITEAEATV
jgi:hypothetical protein